MQKQKPDRTKLNQGLCTDEFKIYVPKSSSLLGYNWSEEKDWAAYVEGLITDSDFSGKPDFETTSTCDCREAWVLHGDLAIEHACRVHDQIHRRALGLENVSAVDVGFVIRERQKKFDNFLAIRVHVNRKQPPERLAMEGAASINLPMYRFPDTASVDQLDSCGNDKHTSRLRDLVCEKLAHLGTKSSSAMRNPISGVDVADLSLYISPKIDELRSLDQVRLCICGVPLDIINAQYGPSGGRSGGDASRGIFVDRPQRADELDDEEQVLIGRGRVNPLAGGISIGSVNGQAGTLGAIVWDRTDGTPCILGNWHVLAGNGNARVGQPTYQPAVFDGGTEDDVVAHLKRWRFGHEGDAALAELSGDRDFASGEVLGLWYPISGSASPRLGMPIRKWGRSTGFTRGFVDGIHLATNINYGRGVIRYFRDQFHIAPLYAGQDVSHTGDSGSLVVTSLQPFRLQNRKRALEGERETIRNWFRSRKQLLDDIGEAETTLFVQCKECFGLRSGYYRTLQRTFAALGRVLRSYQPCSTVSRAVLDMIDTLNQQTTSKYPELRGQVNESLENWRKLADKISRIEKKSTILQEVNLVGQPPDEPNTQGRRYRRLECTIRKIFEEKFLAVGPAGLNFDDNKWFLRLVQASFGDEENFEELITRADQLRKKSKERKTRRTARVYYAVGMIFAGDTPGSPFGEFAVASDIQRLEKSLRFSLRPVFEPHSSFRQLREGPPRQRRGRPFGSGSSLSPGDQRGDSRGGGPQPEVESANSTSDNRPPSG